MVTGAGDFKMGWAEAEKNCMNVSFLPPRCQPLSVFS